MAAWADDLTVTVTYTATTTQAVPMSPEAMALLALLVGVLAMTKLRAKTGRIMGLLFMAGLVGIAGISYSPSSYSSPIQTTLIKLSSGNPAIQSGPIGIFDIVNDTNSIIVITNITVTAPYPITNNCIGKSIAPGQSCQEQIIVT